MCESHHFCSFKYQGIWKHMEKNIFGMLLQDVIGACCSPWRLFRVALPSFNMSRISRDIPVHTAAVTWLRVETTGKDPTKLQRSQVQTIGFETYCAMCSLRKHTEIYWHTETYRDIPKGCLRSKLSLHFANGNWEDPGRGLQLDACWPNPSYPKLNKNSLHTYTSHILTYLITNVKSRIQDSQWYTFTVFAVGVPVHSQTSSKCHHGLFLPCWPTMTYYDLLLYLLLSWGLKLNDARKSGLLPSSKLLWVILGSKTAVNSNWPQV